MYLIFAYSNYYPAGGWNDYCGTASSIDEARGFIKGLRYCNDTIEMWI